MRPIVRHATVISVGISLFSLGVLAGALLLDRGTRVYFSESSSRFTETRVLASSERVRPPLHRMSVVSHGGVMRLEWYNGSWTPLNPRTGCAISLYMDGDRLATALLGGFTGVFESVPASLIWAGHPEPGEHVVEVRVDRCDIGFGVPYADATFPVPDSLYVTEFVG